MERLSVYELSRLSPAFAFGGLGLVLIPAVFARRLITKKAPGRAAAVNLFDRWAIGQDSQWAEVLSDIGTGVGIAIPFAIVWKDASGSLEKFLPDSLVIGEALALDGALNTAVKYLVQRPLPETYAGVVVNRRRKPRGYRAFYSGHVSVLSTALVAGCMTLRLRHGRLAWRWPWLASATLTALVGLGRIFSGKHFLSDVVVGASVGGTIGALMCALRARRSQDEPELEKTGACC